MKTSRILGRILLSMSSSLHLRSLLVSSITSSFFLSSLLPALARPTPQEQLETWGFLKVIEGTCSLSSKQVKFIETYGLNAKYDWVQAGYDNSQILPVLKPVLTEYRGMYQKLVAEMGEAEGLMTFCKVGEKIISDLVRDN